MVWVRCRVGRPLLGWSSIGDWERGIDASNAKQNPNPNPKSKPYLYDNNACLVGDESRDGKLLTISEGISQLRAALREPRRCIRLVGLSGVGKTRLVQALFEEGIGEDPLDSSLAIYTDYSVETNPTARDMARDLVARDQRAILIIDNCNPATHSDLARLCSESASNVSLITVEYDVRDDEPERSEVFRLQSASLDLVSKWFEEAIALALKLAPTADVRVILARNLRALWSYPYVRQAIEGVAAVLSEINRG